MIEVSDLRVDYDDFCAVRDLSLTIGDGEVCGLIGPNGAGKTSTMRAIVGLLEPTYGSIRVNGIDARERPDDAQRTMGFMPDFAPVMNRPVDLIPMPGLNLSRLFDHWLWRVVPSWSAHIF